MLAPTILFAIQVVITPGPPGPTVVLPGGAGVGVSSPGSMSPAGNEVAQAGQLRLSNGYVMVFRQRSAPREAASLSATIVILRTDWWLFPRQWLTG
jgi:hypothetical protein